MIRVRGLSSTGVVTVDGVDTVASNARAGRWGRRWWVVVVGLALAAGLAGGLYQWQRVQQGEAQRLRAIEQVAKLVRLYASNPPRDALPGAGFDLKPVFVAIVGAAQTDPGHAQALALLSEGKAQAAAARLKQSADRLAGEGADGARRAAEVYRWLGYVTLLGSPRDAAAAFARAAELEPEHEQIRFWLGWSNLVAGRHSAAADAYRMVLARPAGAVAGGQIVWSRIGLGDIARGAGKLGVAVGEYRQAEAAISAMSPGAVGDVETGRLKAAVGGRLGHALLAGGNVAGALEGFDKARDGIAMLAKADAENAAVMRDLGLVEADRATGLIAAGRLGEAMVSLRASLEAFKGLAAAKPDDGGRQRDLAVALVRLGDAQRNTGKLDIAFASYSAAHEITVVQATGRNRSKGGVDWQRDLAISYERLGDVEMARANPANALSHYEALGNLADALARAAPDRPALMRLRFLAKIKIGNAKSVLRDLAGAAQSFEAARTFAMQLAEQDPANAQWQRDMLLAQSKLGDGYEMAGRRAEAIRAYHAGYQTAKRLSEKDTANVELKRDLSVLTSKAGSIMLGLGNAAVAARLFGESLQIREGLAALDPGNVTWQRDLANAYGRLGEVMLAVNEVAQAVQLVGKNHDIVRRLASSDPSNGSLQLDLALVYERQANVLRAGRDRDGALAAYERCAAIYTALLKANPGNTSVLVASTVPMIWIGELDEARRKANFEKALAILKALDAQGRLETRRRGNIGYLQRRLAAQ